MIKEIVSHNPTMTYTHTYLIKHQSHGVSFHIYRCSYGKIQIPWTWDMISNGLKNTFDQWSKLIIVGTETPY